MPEESEILSDIRGLRKHTTYVVFFNIILTTHSIHTLKIQDVLVIFNKYFNMILCIRYFAKNWD